MRQSRFFTCFASISGGMPSRTKAALASGFLVVAAGAALLGPSLTSVLAIDDEYMKILRAERGQSAPRGVALVAHPHPLYGGSLDNKVAQTLARAFNELGYVSVRPNFRGVGASEGVHDHGQGEVQDLWAAWQWLITQHPNMGGHRWIGGFSFGAVMATHVAHEWPDHPVSKGQPALDRVVLVGLGISDDRRPAAARLRIGQSRQGGRDRGVARRQGRRGVGALGAPVGAGGVVLSSGNAASGAAPCTMSETATSFFRGGKQVLSLQAL